MNKYQKYPIGNKDTWEQSAKEIISGSTQITSKEIPELLGWLRDINWPGAVLISEYLKSVSSEELVNPIIEILSENDYIWSYWIITNVVNEWDKSGVASLKSVMEELLSNQDFLLEDEEGELEKIYTKNFK